jgi:hypothetical protein
MAMTAEQRSTYPLCGARRRDGQTCRLFAGQGTSHKGVGKCKLHGGSTPTHIASAIITTVKREALQFGEELDLQPAEALLAMLRLSAGQVAFIRGQLAQMSEEQRDEFHGQVLLRMWGEERDRTARIAEAALRVGIEEKQVRIAERYGALLASLIAGILTDLALTPEQQELARMCVPRRLLELEAPPAEAA